MLDFNPLVMRVAHCRADVDALSTTVEKALLLLRAAEDTLEAAEAQLQHAIRSSGQMARLPVLVTPTQSLPDKIIALFSEKPGPLRTSEVAILVGVPNGEMLHQALRRLARRGTHIRRTASGVYERGSGAQGCEEEG